MIKKSSTIILSIAALITTIIALTSLDYTQLSLPYLLGGIIMIAGMVSPYGFAFFVTQMIKEKLFEILFHITTTFLSVGGVITIVYSMFIIKDAQSSLVLLVVPFFQWVGFLLVAVPLLIIQKVQYLKKIHR